MKHSNQQATEENYWQSMADSLVALLLCILLIMLLLMLYLVRIDENQQIDDKLGNSYQKYDDPDDGSGNDRYGYVDNSAGDTYNHDSGHDNGGRIGGGDCGRKNSVLINGAAALAATGRKVTGTGTRISSLRIRIPVPERAKAWTGQRCWCRSLTARRSAPSKKRALPLNCTRLMQCSRC